MIGALAGDIIGRPYEMVNWKSTQFPLFNDKCKPTDDGILTIAIADTFLCNINATSEDIQKVLQDYYHHYPDAGYGMNFKLWAKERIDSFLESDGNGSAMRVSPVAYLSKNLHEILNYAVISARPSHSGKDGLAGAQAIAGSIFTALHTKSKEEVKKFAEQYYKIDFDYDELMANYTEDGRWGYKCAQSVPYAIYCFLISDNFEDAIRKAISIGGDSDTIADMAGAIAEAYYGGVPKTILDKTISYFKNNDELLSVIVDFNLKYLPYNYQIKF